MTFGTSLLPPSAADSATRTDALALAALLVTIFFSLLIAALVLGFAVRYRRRDPAAVGAGIDSNVRLELAWTALPLVVMLGLFTWGSRDFLELQAPPPEARRYTVVGRQWMWKVQHPTGQREIDALHVPVDTPIVLELTSEDVIHSFFVPAFRIKQDVLPGRYTRLWFRATRTGRFHLECAEYCGTDHAAMGGWVYVLSAEDYAAWLARTGPPDVPAVDRLTQLGCRACHVPGDASRAPPLENLLGRSVTLSDGRVVTADEEYVRRALLDPAVDVVRGFPPLMPSYRGQLTEAAILDLIAELRALPSGTGSGR